MKPLNPNALQQIDKMRDYYKLHAHIYDLSRWSFLFGRKALIKKVKELHAEAANILEVGCGTGINLKQLHADFPRASIHGLDVSESMLEKAKRNVFHLQEHVQLINGRYGTGLTQFPEKLDLILFSYSLSMINPQWKKLLIQAHDDLKPGGIIAVVDFYDSGFSWFKNHMGNNHVRMDSHLLPQLRKLFFPEFQNTPKAYAGLWQYFLFIGRKVK